MKLKRIFLSLFFILGGIGLFVWLAVAGLLGREASGGTHATVPIPVEEVLQRAKRQREVRPVGAQSGLANSSQADSQILFGDFHVHTTLSGDAAILSMAMIGGEGSRPPAAACDFARYCSSLDFWSINDHAEQLTPRLWRETTESVRSCNAVNADPQNPDTVAFLGFEWSQMGNSAENHYGHRNVIFAGTDDDEIPTRPIASRAPPDIVFGTLPRLSRAINLLATLDINTLDLSAYFEEVSDTRSNVCADGIPVRDLPADCLEEAATPGELFAKLDDWGHDALVIPHGTTWGNYTPPDSSWKKQLGPVGHDPAWQTLVEVYSGHGTGEVYRPWKAVEVTRDGNLDCPEPTADYLPSCWQAGEIIRGRCLVEGQSEDECNARAMRTRQLYLERGIAGHHVVPGAQVEEWLDSGQCTDCFLPSFNYRPMGSLQYMLALGGFDAAAADAGQGPSLEQQPLRFRFGVIGSSDNHAARPGTGYKEFGRKGMTDSVGMIKGWFNRSGPATDTVSGPAQPDPVDTKLLAITDRAQRDRINSFFGTGGLVAVHSASRVRDDIWRGLKNKHVYGTSGDRMLLWFDAALEDTRYPMGSELRVSVSPTFNVKAVGAFEQLPGCPESSRLGLGADRLQALCRNECYNPSETRKIIERLEVVKITPQIEPGEPVETLIQDPWLVHECPADQLGCSFSFTDTDYAAGARDSVYYVRAIQAASDAVNGGNLRCEFDDEGKCIAVNPCHGDDALTDREDDCLAPVHERAWSSPIFVDFEQG